MPRGWTRRRFTQAALLVAASPSIAIAQKRERIARVGLIANTIPASEIASRSFTMPVPGIIEEGLRERGWIDGKNIELVWKTVEGRYERWPEVIDELARLRPDVLVVFDPRAAIVANQRTRGIPIVHVGLGTLMNTSLIQSVSRPGGNVTGISSDGMPDVMGKRLALLKAAVPQVSRIAIIDITMVRGQAASIGLNRETLAAAESLGVAVFRIVFASPDQLEAAFIDAVGQGANGLVIGNWALLQYRQHQLPVHAAAKRHRLPVMHTIVGAAESGGLMAYGLDIAEYYRKAPHYIDKILRGAKPADLPILKPDKFQFVVNLSAARAIGLAIPATVLVQADRVIE